VEFLENRTYDEIRIGDQASLVRTLELKDIQLFAAMSGDINPAHLDPEYAKSTMFQEVIAHGMWGGALISTVLGTQLPGPGTIYLSQSLQFSKPVTLGDTLTVTVTAARKYEHHHNVIFDCRCVNQHGVVVISGTASDTGGGVLASVEVSLDGGSTWFLATGTSNWQYPWTATGNAPVTIKAMR